MNEAVSALQKVAHYIALGDALSLCGHLADDLSSGVAIESGIATDLGTEKQIGRGREQGVELEVEQEKNGHSRVAFIGHFLKSGDITHWDHSLKGLSDEAYDKMLSRTLGVMTPFVVKQETLSSPNGSKVEVIVVGIPLSSKQFEAALKGHHTQEVSTLVSQAVELAEHLGASLIGLGGYTSILTNNGMELKESSAALTTGNSLTAAAVMEVVLQSAAAKNIDFANATLGIVGAVGNIGSVLAELMLEEGVGKIKLISRGSGRRRMDKLAKRLSAAAEGGMQTSIPSQSKPFKTSISIETDLSALKACDLIISATNAAKPIIFSDHISDKAVVICDVATPNDVCSTVVNDKPHALLIRGGILKLPEQQTFDVDGMNLGDGKLYACLAETVVLGMAGITDHFSYGPLETAKVRYIRTLAKQYGFQFENERVNR